MRVVVQRVDGARVEVDGAVVGAIDRGLLAYVGFGAGDDAAVAKRLLSRVLVARVFPDDAGRMNLDLAAICGVLLLVPQFTLYGDVSQRRPYFGGALAPDSASKLFDELVAFAQKETPRVAAGRFGAHMRVVATNDGPVTLLYEEAAAGA
jgi:D-aminoacyl-tRNA deacylase